MATQGVVSGGITALEAPPEPKQHRGLWTDAWRRLIRNRLAITAVVVLTLVTLIAFVGAYVGPLARYDSNDQNYDAVQQGPSMEHWFGTDQLGRDMFARVLEGIRISLQIGVGAAVVVLLMGVSVGAAAAMGGTWSDNLLMRFADVMISLPEILAIILLRSVLIGHSWPVVTNKKMIIILAIGLVAWITVARLVRGQMLSLAERDFVVAARALGASRWRIVFTHMLPNTLGPVIVAVTFAIPAAIFAEAALGFLGLGLPPPAASLGTLVSAGYSVIQRNVWNVVFPAAAVALLMLCFTFVGDGLRDALDPRTR